MLTNMVELAKVCGDIRENALVPDQVIFRHNAYWTSHFGGIYVFVDPDMTTVISDPAAPGFRRSRPWQVSYICRSNDADKVFSFLGGSGRLDLPRASWSSLGLSRTSRRDGGAFAHPPDRTDAISIKSTRSGCRPGSMAMPI